MSEREKRGRGGPQAGLDPADKGGLCSLEHMDIDLLPAVSLPICLGEDCNTSILHLPPAVSMETNPFIPLNYSIGQLFFSTWWPFCDCQSGF